MKKHTSTMNNQPLPEITMARFVDNDLYQAEIDNVFRKTWLLVGHISEFPEVGTYRLLHLPFAPVFLVLGRDGTLRAFLNSCRHRGASVLREERGIASAFSCRFHGWTYSHEGKLTGVPHKECFPDVSADSHSLIGLRCELWGGLVFINFDQQATPLLKWLGPLAERHIEMVNAPLRVIWKTSFEVNCNWKILENAFREAYHVNFIHPKSIGPMVKADDTWHDFHPNGHYTMYVPYAKKQGASSISMQETSLPTMPGSDSAEFCDNVLATGLFPNVLLSLQAGGFPVQQFWPLSVNRSRFDAVWYGMDWGEGPMPEEWHERIIPAFEIIAAEDCKNVESIQKSMEAVPSGMKSPLHNRLEIPVYQFHTEIDRLIGAESIPEHLRVENIPGFFP